MKLEDFYTLTEHSHYDITRLATHVRIRARVHDVNLTTLDKDNAYINYRDWNSVGSTSAVETPTKKLIVYGGDYSVDFVLDCDSWPPAPGVRDLIHEQAAELLAPKIKAHLQPLFDEGLLNEEDV